MGLRHLRIQPIVSKYAEFYAWANNIQYSQAGGVYFESKDENGNITCPINCPNSVTFLGKCITPEDLENIIFGFGACVAGIPQGVAHLGQNWKSIIKTRGETDTEMDHAGTDAGYDIASVAGASGGVAETIGGAVLGIERDQEITKDLLDAALANSEAWKKITSLGCPLCPNTVSGPTLRNPPSKEGAPK